MGEVGKQAINDRAESPRSAVIFGASGGIGSALVDRLRQMGCAKIYAGSRSGAQIGDATTISFAFDLTNESTISDAALLMHDEPPEWVIVASGALSLESGVGPERTLRKLDPDVMAQVFALNTIGPALIAKHFLPLMRRDERFVFAALSARVGSISDNQLGGWHSYRASKAALNMLIKNFANEMGRTHKQGVVVGLHPGTVDTELSKPFQKGLPDGQLTEPIKAAQNLLGVMSRLTPEDSGGVFDFAGKLIAP